MRAAYAALVLGLIAGLALATGVLSSPKGFTPRTVAGVLAVDVAGPDFDRRRVEAVAVLVARCMTWHGFAWTPWVEPPPPMPDADLPPTAWAERWGFGMSTTVGHPRPLEVADPNLSTLAGLPPSERDALGRALFGDDREPGCQAAATDEVFGLRQRLMAPLRPALEELDRRIAADPAVVELVSTWRTCVAPVAQGVPAERATLSGILMSAISDRLEDLGPAPASLAALGAIQAEERRTATMLARCEESFATGRRVMASRYEAMFVAEHEAALRRVGAGIRDAEAALPTLPP